jgi:hypothetical protein
MSVAVDEKCPLCEQRAWNMSNVKNDVGSKNINKSSYLEKIMVLV